MLLEDQVAQDKAQFEKTFYAAWRSLEHGTGCSQHSTMRRRVFLSEKVTTVPGHRGGRGWGGWESLGGGRVGE